MAGGAFLASLAANPELVEHMMELDKKAWISALCQLGAILAAFLKASPLPISDEGRRKYAAKSDTVRLDR